MPCQLCELRFPSKPCEQYNIEIQDKFYNKLKKYCPCEICLVKMICVDKRFNCKDWDDWLILYETGL